MRAEIRYVHRHQNDDKGTVMTNKRPDSFESLLADDEVARLRAENTALREEIDALHHELAVEGCHIAGLTAQIQALITESEACPDKAAHPLVERVEFRHSRTGEPLRKTAAYPLYRAAFDAEAEQLGLDNPEQYRA